MSSHQWLLFLPAAILVGASPGAGNFLALNNGLRCGLWPTVIALCGRFIAFAIMILVATLGAGALIAASATAFSIMKWLGVAYLVWLSFHLWLSDSLPLESGNNPNLTSVRQLALREFVVAITNPKAMLLFTAFLPQFLSTGRPAPSQFIALGGAYILIEFAAATGYAAAGSRIKVFRLNRRSARRVNRASAGVMLLAAAWLAAMKRAS